MTTRMRGTAVRWTLGALVAAGGVLAVVAGVAVPWPTLEREPVSVSVTPAAASSAVTCTGGLLALGRSPDDAAGMELASPQTVTAGVLDGAPDLTSESLQSRMLPGVDGPLLLSAAPWGRDRSDIGASGQAWAEADDLRGYAASACRPPLIESWLVGGSAGVGAADLLLLANPGTVAATVDVTTYGAGGAESPPGATGVVVPPRSQVVLPLAGIVVGEQSPVLRVTASGAPVVASLQASLMRTLVASGVDQVGAIARPEERVQIVGVTIADVEEDVGGGAPTAVRIMSPSQETDATIVVRAAGEETPAIPATTVPLEAGVPTTVQLRGLPDGLYGIEVVAGAPVVAAAQQWTGTADASDFAWQAAAPHVASPSLFATPAGPVPVLMLVNPGEEPATVIVEAVGGGAPAEVTVAPGSSASMRLSAETVYRLDAGSLGIRAAVSLAGEGALAGFPVWPADAAAPAVLVYP